MEGLVLKDRKTLQPRPGMAESWEISDDGRVYTFKIRNNAKWSNGDPLRPEILYGRGGERSNPHWETFMHICCFPLKMHRIIMRG